MNSLIRNIQLTAVLFVLFATILGFIFFDERIDLITIICGGGLIICTNLTALNLKNNDKTKTLLSNN